MATRSHAAFEISQREWDDQIAWLSGLAREQKELCALERLIREYPEHARTALQAVAKVKGAES